MASSKRKVLVEILSDLSEHISTRSILQQYFLRDFYANFFEKSWGSFLQLGQGSPMSPISMRPTGGGMRSVGTTMLQDDKVSW